MMFGFLCLAEVTAWLYNMPIRVLMSVVVGISRSDCVRGGTGLLVDNLHPGFFLLKFAKLFSNSNFNSREENFT